MYILKCADGSFYVGSTWNLEQRVYQHQNGEGAKYTQRRLPVELVYSTEFDRIDDAFAWEKQVQNWSRAKRLALIEGRLEDLPKLSRSVRPLVSTSSTDGVGSIDGGERHRIGRDRWFRQAQPTGSAQPTGWG